MFGIGGWVKTRIASARLRASDWRLERSDPAALDYFRRLCVESYDPDYFVHVFGKFKTIYVEVPKAASTTVLATFAEAINGRTFGDAIPVHKRKLTGLTGPREIGLDKFHTMVEARDFSSFTFVRNPYRRLVSCWVDKVAVTSVGRKGLVVRQLLALPEASGLKLDPAQPIPFPVFVDLACASARARLNGHWNLMSDIVPRILLPIDFIGKVEALQTDLPMALEMAGIANTAKIQSMNIKRSEKHGELLTQELADKIYRGYEEDFDRFGYSRQWQPN